MMADLRFFTNLVADRARTNHRVLKVPGIKSIKSSDLSRYVQFLLGYFQDVQLADSVAPEILSRFSTSQTFHQLTSGKLVEQLCVHVRRGDYVTNQSAKDLHGLLNDDYFINGCLEIRLALGLNQVLIISDDYPLVQNAIVPALRDHGFDIELGRSGVSAVEDLGNLANSRGVVCSNSSFSWWGAWLASRQHSSYVVVPLTWFRKSTPGMERLIDQKWHQLENRL